VRLWKKPSEGSIATVCVEKHPPFRQHPAWILTLVSVLTLRQMDGSLDFSLLLRDSLSVLWRLSRGVEGQCRTVQHRSGSGHRSKICG
jgi:hypothetical protein